MKILTDSSAGNLGGFVELTNILESTEYNKFIHHRESPDLKKLTSKVYHSRYLYIKLDFKGPYARKAMVMVAMIAP